LRQLKPGRYPLFQSENNNLWGFGLHPSYVEQTTPFFNSFFLYSSFLDFALLYNISNDNRLIFVDIFIGKE